METYKEIISQCFRLVEENSTNENDLADKKDLGRKDALMDSVDLVAEDDLTTSGKWQS